MNKEFEKIYLEIINKQNQHLLNEGKFLNNLIAGVGGLAMTGGAVLGLNELSKTDNKIQQPIQPKQQIVQIAEPSAPKPKQQTLTQVKQNNNTWILNLTLPFIMQYEGAIKDSNGNHVLYDDNVNKTVKRRWNGKGRTSWY